MQRVLASLKQYVLPPVVCFGVALLLAQTPFFKAVENLTLDLRIRLRAGMEVTLPPDELVLLGVDERSLRDIGRWPFNREVHGHLMELLSRVRPSVVTWDVLFTEETPADGYFGAAIARNRATVLGAMSVENAEDGLLPAAAQEAGVRLQPLTHVEGDRSKIPTSPAMLVPVGVLGKVASIGFVDTPPGLDGVRRTAPLVVRIGDEVYPSLALRTLMDYWAAEPANVTVRLGDAIVVDAPLARRRIPIDAAGGYAINYRHGPEGFNQRGYSAVLTDLTRRYESKAAVGVVGLTGRMLLVGQVADGLADLGPTPFSPLTPLMLVHANVIENVLREDYVRRFPPWVIWGGGLLVAVVGLVRFSDRRPLEQGVFAAFIPVAFVAAATLGWVNGSWVVPIVGPLIGFVAVQGVMIGRRMIAEIRAKEQIKGMFGTYVSPELVKRLVAAGRQPELGGHEDEITAYFSDIESFSTFSEVLSPAQLVELMNEYLTACTDIVQGEGGTLDKYIGDAIVAMFGAPVPLPDHAYRACLAVIAVQARMDELRARWAADGRWPEMVTRMRSRIGLNTGPCVIGNMGSRTRFNYTMMGDNVNLAARMESGAKQWGTYAMCTEATRDACRVHGGDAVIFRALGRIKVKGRSTAVPVHEIAGLRSSLPAASLECFDLFARGLDRYYERDWDGAESLFRQSAALELLVPDKAAGVRSNPSLVYLALVTKMRAEPPNPGWDGVYEMKEK